MLAVAPPLLTVAEVARRLRQSEDTIRRKIGDGTIEAVRLGEHGPLRVPEEALADHLRPASSAQANPEHPSLRAGPLAGSARALNADHEEDR